MRKIRTDYLGHIQVNRRKKRLGTHLDMVKAVEGERVMHVLLWPTEGR
jgi:hypothetical protein